MPATYVHRIQGRNTPAGPQSRHKSQTQRRDCSKVSSAFRLIYQMSLHIESKMMKTIFRHLGKFNGS